MKNLVLVGVALMAAEAAAQRLTILPFTGPASNASRNQLVTAICDTADCVPASRVTAGKKPDWKKMKKEAVAVLVQGTVSKRGKAMALDLAVLDRPGAPRAAKKLPLQADGTLSARNLSAAIEVVRAGAGSGKKAEPEPEPEPEPKKAEPPPEKKAEPAPEPKKEPAAEPKREPAEAKREPAAEPKREPREEPRPEPAPPASKKRAAHFLILEVGADLTHRAFDYVNPVTTNLRRYELPFLAVPTVKAELYPLALVDASSALAGLGIEGGLGLAPWLKSKRPNTTDAFPTSLLRLDGGLKWTITPLRGAVSFSFAPAVGIRLHSFTVGAAADGTRLEGLPNLSYLGLRAGLGLELGLLDGLLAIFGRFSVLPVFSSGEIISPAFFLKGSNFGIEASAGVGVSPVPFLQVRASFEFTRYALAFQATSTDTYQAQGATDVYLGANVAARLMF